MPGQNMLSPDDVTSRGFDYVSIGRDVKPASLSAAASFAASLGAGETKNVARSVAAASA